MYRKLEKATNAAEKTFVERQQELKKVEEGDKRFMIKSLNLMRSVKLSYTST